MLLIIQLLFFSIDAFQCEFNKVKGSICDGIGNDTLLLQSGLNECGTMIIKTDANCTTLPLDIPSNTQLIVQKGGVLQAIDRGSWPKEHMLPLLSSSNTHNLSITGEGVFDGHGEQWWPHSIIDLPRPKVLELNNVSNVLLESFTVRNPAFYAIDIVGGKNYKIYRVKIFSPNFQTARNTDGIDIAASNVHVNEVEVVNGDDSLCIKSPAANVLIENSIVSQGNGLVIGTSDNANIHNITYRNITANDTTFGCHIKFKGSQTGSISNITFDDIRIFQSVDAMRRRVLHGDWAGYAIGIHQNDQGQQKLVNDHRQLKLAANQEQKKIEDSYQPHITSNVRISNITYRKIRAEGLFGGEFICGKGILICSGIKLEDVFLNVSRKGCTFVNAIGSNSNVQPNSCFVPSEY